MNFKNMLAKSSLLYGIINCKCPQCHSGNLFVNQNHYNLKHTLEMNEKCNSCGLYYEKEPGFWTGAMYISYVLIVGMVLISLLILYLLLEQKSEVIIGVNFSIVVLSYPLLLRYSRVLYLYLFIRYKKS